MFRGRCNCHVDRIFVGSLKQPSEVRNRPRAPERYCWYDIPVIGRVRSFITVERTLCPAWRGCYRRERPPVTFVAVSQTIDRLSGLIRIIEAVPWRNSACSLLAV